MKVLLTILAINLIALVRGEDLSPSNAEIDFLEELERIEVCIDKHLGCFEDSKPAESSPVSDWFETNYFMSSRATVGTQFRFWAPGKNQATVITNENFHEYIVDNDPNYDTSLKAIFIIHGYQGGDAPWALTMKDALMQKEKANIFIVDWSGGDGFLYGTARANTWIVGAETGRLIERLGLKTGLTLDKVHLIGHSLGSHAAGFAGKWLKYKLKKRVRRITGLDVAGPDFEDYEIGRRLDRSDAEFVDTIHSNAALSVTDGFGIVKPVGHFDFYPNGGELQPGCETTMGAVANIASETLEIINPMYSAIANLGGDKDDIGDAVEDLSCNHGRAIQFFIESIASTSCQFIAEECNSWADYLAGNCHTGAKVPMGYDSESYKQYMDQYASKKFFLSTNSKTPFCKKL